MQGPGLTVYGISGYIGPRVGFCLLEQPPWNFFPTLKSPHPVGSKTVHRQLFSREHGKGCELVQSKNTFIWAVLSDEQMSNGYPFSLLNDEQMSNKVGVEHQPVMDAQMDVSKNRGILPPKMDGL